MAIVLATFILAVQEILNLLYFALLFINDYNQGAKNMPSFNGLESFYIIKVTVDLQELYGHH